MYKNIILLLVSLTLTGCVERSYQLTTDSHTHTAIAQSSTNIHTNPQIKLEKMKSAVTKVLTKKISNKEDNKLPKSQFIHLKDENELLFSTTKDLIFKRLSSTYQKFGNSEIHGHVIYLTQKGLETRLKNTSIYLLETNKKLNHWYNNAYFTNSHDDGKAMIVNYLNSTHLDLSKNFAFYGIASGEYFVIIVSDSPDQKDKKIYIAKKIKVETHKKIISVFSKKL